MNLFKTRPFLVVAVAAIALAMYYWCKALRCRARRKMQATKYEYLRCVRATPVPMDKSGPPQKSDRLPSTDTLSIDVDLVNVDVVVTDQSGNPVTGLEKTNFKVFDDNAEQTVTNFSLDGRAADHRGSGGIR